MSGPHSNSLASALGACTFFMPMVGGIIADSYYGRFNVIFYMAAFYLCGQVILTIITSTHGDIGTHGLSIMAMFMIFIGAGAIKPCVSTFAADQYDVTQEQAQKVYFTWFYMSIQAGALLSVIVTPMIKEQRDSNGEQLYWIAFLVTTVLMSASYIILLLGTSFYKHQDRGEKNPFTVVADVLREAWQKRKSKPQGEANAKASASASTSPSAMSSSQSSSPNDSPANDNDNDNDKRRVSSSKNVVAPSDVNVIESPKSVSDAKDDDSVVGPLLPAQPAKRHLSNQNTAWDDPSLASASASLPASPLNTRSISLPSFPSDTTPSPPEAQDIAGLPGTYTVHGASLFSPSSLLAAAVAPASQTSPLFVMSSPPSSVHGGMAFTAATDLPPTSFLTSFANQSLHGGNAFSKAGGGSSHGGSLFLKSGPSMHGGILFSKGAPILTVDIGPASGKRAGSMKTEAAAGGGPVNSREQWPLKSDMEKGQELSTSVPTDVPLTDSEFKEWMVANKAPREPSWLDPARSKYGDDAVDAVHSLGKISVLFGVLIIFWTLYGQIFTLWIYQATCMDLHIGNVRMAPEHVGVLNIVVVLLLAEVFARYLYPWLDMRGFDVSAIRRILVGQILAMLAMVASGVVEYFITSGSDYVDIGGFNEVGTWCPNRPLRVLGWFWQVPQYVLISVAEILVSISSIELAYRQAPDSMKSVVSALNLWSSAFGYIINIGMAYWLPTLSHGFMLQYFTFAGLQLVGVMFFWWVTKQFQWALD